jgi:hypothetical protein
LDAACHPNSSAGKDLDKVLVLLTGGENSENCWPRTTSLPQTRTRKSGMKEPSAPAASVIIAAYNRATVLGYAIRSVLQQDFADWELLVIGDGCTDDSEAVVRSFGDPRIVWENLPVNSGGQSAPNNRGVEMARGRYVFFLAQDDLFFADHLSHSIAQLEATGADMLWSPAMVIWSLRDRTGPPKPWSDCIVLDGVTRDGNFQPEIFMTATSWALRRSVHNAVGAWVHADEAYVSPSQEWIFRAWRKGIDLRFDSHVSVMCVHAGPRSLAYARSLHPEHERAWSWIKDRPGVSLELLTTTAVYQASELFRRGVFDAWPQSRWLPIIRFCAPLLARVGLHPLGLQRQLAGEPKGQFVRDHRKFTSEVPTIGRDGIPITTREGDAFLGFGWHSPEPEGRWTCASAAEVIFRRSRGGRAYLKVVAYTLRPGETARFSVNGVLVAERRMDAVETVLVSLPDDEDARTNLVIETDPPTTPEALGQSDDGRYLGLRVLSIGLVETGEEDD